MQLIHPFGTSSHYMKLVAANLVLDVGDAPGLFVGTGVDFKQIKDSERIDARSLSRMYDNAADMSTRTEFNLHMGSLFHLSTHGPLGLAVQTAPNLLSALRILVRFSCIREDFVRYRLERHRAGITLVLESARPGDPVGQPQMELMLSMTCHMIDTLLGHHPHGMRVTAAYPAPEHRHLYQEYLKCPVKFSADRNEILIPEPHLRCPCPQGNPQLHTDALNQCRATYRVLEDTLDIRARVETVMEFDKTVLHLAEVARQLGLSTRTLSRKLQQANASFQSIRDNHLKGVAANLIRDSKQTMEDIGYRLGYHDAANFRRAFLRWYGQTPSDYRRRLRQNR
ncbi:MAG: AraC family transcriptional regulator [Gammaproteobacteria bacterium]|nr:AraC family transcriptional regulator [Gammaproteobacteria bacterium]